MEVSVCLDIYTHLREIGISTLAQDSRGGSTVGRFNIPPPGDGQLQAQGNVQEIEEGCIASSVFLRSRLPTQLSTSAASTNMYTPGRKPGQRRCSGLRRPETFSHRPEGRNHTLTRSSTRLYCFLVRCVSAISQNSLRGHR